MKKIVARVEDLMFRAKIDAAARHLAVGVEFVTNGADLARACAGGPAVLLVELTPGTLEEVQKMFPAGKVSVVPVVAFAPHQDKALLEAAHKAGIGRVLARSQFAESLPDLIHEFTAPGLSREAEEEPELPDE